MPDVRMAADAYAETCGCVVYVPEFFIGEYCE
jgi:hypothetical protein